VEPRPGRARARLSDSTQGELFEQGHRELRSRHGWFSPTFDEDGIRATELARLSGRHKQIIGRLVDELEQLGYVQRRPDPADRRAKLVVPTGRGLEAMQLGDEIVAQIERRYAAASGRRTYAEFRNVLRAIVEPRG